MRATATTPPSSPQAIKLIKARLVDLGLSDDQLAELTLVYDKGNNSKTNQPLADELAARRRRLALPLTAPRAAAESQLDQFHEIEQMPGTLAHRTRKEVYGQQRTIVALMLGAVRLKAAAQLSARRSPRPTASLTSCGASWSAAAIAWTSAPWASGSRRSSNGAG